MKKVSLLFAALACSGAVFAQNGTTTKMEAKTDAAATKTKTTVHKVGAKTDRKMHVAHAKVKKTL